MVNRFKRTDRIAELIQRALAEIIRLEIKKPAFITLSAIMVSKDLAHAKVYFTVFDHDIQETQILLNTASGHLRSLLAKAVKLRVVPELHFIYDTSIEYGTRLSKLIDKVNENIPPDESE